MMRMMAWVLAALVTLLTAAWGSLAIWYQFPGGMTSRWAASLTWVALVIALVLFAWLRRSWMPLAFYTIAFIGLLLWWSTIRPSNTRIWSDDVARMLTGAVNGNGNQVTLYNVRNFNWRTDTDYDARWETRSYNLDHLATIDTVLSYWGIPSIAHAMISFGFDDGSHIVFSVEIRKKRGGAYSPIGGFFKAYERTVVAADEHDIIRVRTNVRGEDDYLYNVQMSKQAMRALFIAYIGEANELSQKPAYYNTLTSNCITVVYGMARHIEPGLPFDYRLLLTGRLPGYLYDTGALGKGVPLQVLTERGHITSRALATPPDADFSKAIRVPVRGSDAHPSAQ
jgi:hypothetical protein